MEADRVTAIAYIRVSSQRQVTDGNSLVVQRNLVTRYAEARGIKLQHIFVEEAETAKNDDRPELQEMLAKLASGEIVASVLIIPKIDRLARNRDDYGDIKKALKRSGVRLESCTETLEDTPVGRFTETMLASVAQFDNEIRAERSRGGMIQAVEEGRWVWRAPLGYKNVRIKTRGKKGGLGTIAPDEPMSALIRELFDRIGSKRQGVREASDWLAKHGVMVTRSNVYSLLRSPVYCGVIQAFGSEYEGKPPFVPLISREQFALVQEVIVRNPNLPTVYDHDNPDYPLRGCLRCEECGRFLTGAWATGRTKRFPYYRCLDCPSVNLKRDAYHDEFVGELCLFKPEPDAMAKLIAYAESIHRRDSAESIVKRESLNGELTRIIALRRQVALKTAEGIIPDDLGKEQITSLTAELGRLEMELKQAEVVPNELVRALKFAEVFFRELPIHWRRIGVNAQKKLQTFFFPEGLVAERAGNLRTADYPLLEQVKAAIHGGLSNLVDQKSELPNDVARFILRLREEFDEGASIIADAESEFKNNRAA